MSLQETFDINYYHCYCTFIHCGQKKVSHNLEKKVDKSQPKKRKNHIFV